MRHDLEPPYNSPLLLLFFEEEGLFSGVVLLFLSFSHFQVKLLDDGRSFSVDLNRSVPAGIGNPVEGFEISFDPLPKSGKILLLVLIGIGDAREVKGEVPFLKGLLSSV